MTTSYVPCLLYFSNHNLFRTYHKLVTNKLAILRHSGKHVRYIVYIIRLAFLQDESESYFDLFAILQKRYSGSATFIECSASDGARVIKI